MPEPVDQADDLAPVKATKDAKAWKAFELRKSGAPYERIAEALGYKNASTAEAAARRVMKQAYSGDAEELLALELARLDQMLMVLWPKVREGSFQAMDRVLKVMQQRQQYVLGLAPKNGTTNVNVDSASGVVIVGGSSGDYVQGLQAARAALEAQKAEDATVIDVEPEP